VGCRRAVTSLADLERWIDESGLVSAQQRDAIGADGNFFLLSRPGSGKTRTAGIRVARLAAQQPSLRVAATSYTNVAIRQIRETIRERGVTLDGRHFTGTLHQFLLDYVLYPFGHLLEIKQPLNLIIADDWTNWPDVIYDNDLAKRLSVAKLHYMASGAFKVQKRPKGMTREHAETSEVMQVRKLKKEARKRGLVSGSDAMFYSQKILEEHPEISAAVAERFDEIIVDEAQDTTDVQLKCLALIHATGKLRSLVLVGDTDQSIYSFQGANPDLCKELVSQLGLTEVPLKQNFRSSQAICNVTCRFCRREDADEAVGPHKDCAITPEILLFEPTDPGSAVKGYEGRLELHGIATTRSVVLARGNNFRDQINGLARPEGVNRFITALGRLRAAHLEKRTVDHHELQRAERFLAQMAWGDVALLRETERHLTVRRMMMRLIADLPDFDRTLHEWIVEARAKVTAELASLTDSPAKKPQHVVKSKNEYKSISAADSFSIVSSSMLARTVHDAKGESHEAVLLVVQPKKQGQADQAGLWSAPLLGEAVDADDEEELRIAYVALTRAERYCAVALPANVATVTLEAYLAAGFIKP
jgi:DNA helicase-2/ATP-dependent DNA helicase PcrA